MQPQPQRSKQTHAQAQFQAFRQYRTLPKSSTQSRKTPPVQPLDLSETVLDELRELRDIASEHNTDQALSLFLQTLSNMEQYMKQMPVIFQDLFEDLKQDVSQIRIWYRSIESDYREKILEYTPYSNERNRVVDGAFNRLKDFEKEFIKTKNRFYQEIHACNTHLDSFPVVEFVVKLSMDNIPENFLPDLLQVVNGMIPESVGGRADVVHIRPGSTIYSIRLPIEAVRNVLDGFRNEVFKPFEVTSIVFIYSLSNSKTFKEDKVVEYTSYTKTKMKQIFVYAFWILLASLFITLILMGFGS